MTASLSSLRSRPTFIQFGVSQQTLFARRLALYLHSGIPIARALAFIVEDATSPSAKYVFTTLENTVAMGLPLSRGLELFPKQFDSFSVGFVRAGEASGRLSETLERLAVILHKRNSLRGKILSALAYPALILVGTISIALFLTLFIFPKIVPILRGFKTALPYPTRVLIGINTLVAHDWIVLVLSCVGTISLFAIGLRISRIRMMLEKVLLYIPILSLTYQYYAMATFARTLSLQLKGGIGIIPALAIVRTALPGVLYPKAIDVLEKDIAKGQRFSFALRQHKKLFPLIVCQMVAASEATGTLSTNLESLAEMYEEHLDELAKSLTVLIEPVLMVCMGLVVGFVALAIITPIYAVTQNLNAK